MTCVYVWLWKEFWWEGFYLWTAYRSTHVWCHRAAAWGHWSGHCTQHSPSCHPPRSYLLWRKSPPAQKQTKTILDISSAFYWVLMRHVDTLANTSLYLQENHRTIPRLQDIQGLSYLSPPKTSDPLFWKGGAEHKHTATQVHLIKCFKLFTLTVTGPALQQSLKKQPFQLCKSK